MRVGHDATMNCSSGTSSSKHRSSHSVVPSDPMMTEVAAMSSQTATRNPEVYRPRCAVSCDLQDRRLPVASRKMHGWIVS